MAQQNRTTLKNYFQTGDKPSQTQYADLIDSNLNLQDTSDQTMQGALRTNDVLGRTDSTSRIEIGNGEILVLANDVDMFTLKGSTNSIVIENNNHITSSGNISASGYIVTPEIYFGGDGTPTNAPVFIKHIESGDNLQIVGGGLLAAGNITASGNISGSATSTLSIWGAATFGTSTVVINGSAGHITASGNISSSGNIIAETGSFDNGIILKAPNGNQFRFTIDNSGHLSLTGSAV